MKKKPRFVRFRDLTEKDVNRDLQIHTLATDGKGTVREVIEKARSIGLREIAFTEHVRRTSSYFPQFVEEVQNAREGFSGLEIYVGFEAKANDSQGTLDVSPKTLAMAEIVLGSVHRFPVENGDLVSAKNLEYEEAVALEFKLALGLIQNAPIDVLAHPGGMCLRAHGKFPKKYFKELMSAALDYAVAIEINSSYLRDMDSFLELCWEMNPLVSIGSDVHEISDLGSCRNALLSRKIGCQSI